MKMTNEKDDEIKIGPEVSPGVRAALRRSPDGEVREVAVKIAEEGVPVSPSGELAYIDEGSNDGWHKLISLYKSGPAQVSTPAYRDGYDRIFGKQKVGVA
jgi:hypothetical protein